MLDQLPHDLLTKVVQGLGCTEILSLIMCCKTTKEIVEHLNTTERQVRFIIERDAAVIKKRLDLSVSYRLKSGVCFCLRIHPLISSLGIVECFKNGKKLSGLDDLVNHLVANLNEGVEGHDAPFNAHVFVMSHCVCLSCCSLRCTNFKYPHNIFPNVLYAM
jgi:hypothetical protein